MGWGWGVNVSALIILWHPFLPCLWWMSQQLQHPVPQYWPTKFQLFRCLHPVCFTGFARVDIIIIHALFAACWFYAADVNEYYYACAFLPRVKLILSFKFRQWSLAIWWLEGRYCCVRRCVTVVLISFFLLFFFFFFFLIHVILIHCFRLMAFVGMKVMWMIIVMSVMKR